MIDTPALDEFLATANFLGINAAIVEKDWWVAQSLAAIKGMNHGESLPAFGGGTSLAKAYKCINRFSEDIDYKVVMPLGERRDACRAYRNRLIEAIQDIGLTLSEEPFVRDKERFFRLIFNYPNHFQPTPSMRPEVQIEVSLGVLAQELEPETCVVSSYIQEVSDGVAELPAIACVSPVETAADKVSALTWRVCSRVRGATSESGKKDDPRIIRHLHDLAALIPTVQEDGRLLPLVRKMLHADTLRDRDASRVPPDSIDRLDRVAAILSGDEYAQWEQDYNHFVGQFSLTGPEGVPNYAEALACFTVLGDQIKAYLREHGVTPEPLALSPLQDYVSIDYPTHDLDFNETQCLELNETQCLIHALRESLSRLVRHDLPMNQTMGEFMSPFGRPGFGSLMSTKNHPGHRAPEGRGRLVIGLSEKEFPHKEEVAVRRYLISVIQTEIKRIECPPALVMEQLHSDQASSEPEPVISEDKEDTSYSYP